MYYHLKIHMKHDPLNWEWISDLNREQLEQRLLAPYRTASPIQLRGMTTLTDDMKRITIDETDVTWATKAFAKMLQMIS